MLYQDIHRSNFNNSENIKLMVGKQRFQHSSGKTAEGYRSFVCFYQPCCLNVASS